AVLSVTVNKASQPDPGPDPDPGPPVDPDTDPNPPVSPGGGNTGSGAGDSGANKPGTTLPGTGDASMLSIVVLGGLGLAAAIAGIKRRDESPRG
ncbi:LPXTG cell wall anchor domain-containing protein, partial [Collinsella stercoris]|uniref:LPXTG cell wall anchor domain-containing protein n=1 Tax=Collinsella stercoris TaxID=147206 RepID=UPI0023F0F29B